MLDPRLRCQDASRLLPGMQIILQEAHRVQSVYFGMHNVHFTMHTMTNH